MKKKDAAKVWPGDWDSAHHPWVINVPEDTKRADMMLEAAKALRFLCAAIQDSVKVVVQNCHFDSSGKSPSLMINTPVKK